MEQKAYDVFPSLAVFPVTFIFVFRRSKFVIESIGISS